MTGEGPKVVFITGATSGIGQATAEAFAARGAELLLLGRRKERLSAIKAKLKSARVTTWSVDVRDRIALGKGAKKYHKLLERADVVVNAAGLALGREPLQETKPEDWDVMIDTNIKGLLHTTRLVLPHMIKRGAGHVINLGSITGRQVYRGGAVYAATKFAVRAITEALRHDVIGTGVRVTSVDPGMVETEFSLVRYGGDSALAKKVYEGFRPLSPADVAETIVWVATRPAHVNVQELLIMPTDQAAVATVHRRTK